MEHVASVLYNCIGTNEDSEEYNCYITLTGNNSVTISWQIITVTLCKS